MQHAVNKPYNTPYSSRSHSLLSHPLPPTPLMAHYIQGCFRVMGKWMWS